MSFKSEVNTPEPDGDEDAQNVEEAEVNDELIKKMFLKYNNLKEIDKSQHAYLSVNKVREICTEILQPTLIKGNQETKMLKELQKEMKMMVED